LNEKAFGYLDTEAGEFYELGTQVEGMLNFEDIVQFEVLFILLGFLSGIPDQAPFLRIIERDLLIERILLQSYSRE